MKQVLSILLQAKDETRGATASAASNFSSLSQKITAASVGFLAIRQAAQDAIGVIDTLVGSVVRDSAEFDAFSRRIGISAEALSELKYAGEVANVPLNQLTMGAQRLTRRLGEIAKFGRGEAKPALEALGISIESIIDLRADEQLELILEALGGVANESERAALAMKFFDSEGVALVQLAGRTKELREEARQLGVSLDQDMIDRAVTARENMLRLKGAVEGVRNAVAEEILLQFDEARADKLIELAKELAPIAGQTITFAIEIASGVSDFLAFLRERGFVKFDAEIGEAAQAVAAEVARLQKLGIEIPVEVDGERLREQVQQVILGAASGNLQIPTDELEALAERLRNLSIQTRVEVDESQLMAASDSLDEMKRKAEETSSSMAASFKTGVAEIIAEMGTTEEALNRAVALAVQLGVPFEQIPPELRNVKAELDSVFVASGIVRAEWENISAIATDLGHTQASLTRQLADMVEAGVPIEEAWGRILERIGYTDEKLAAIIEKMPELVANTAEAEKAFNLFNTSMEEAAERLNRSMRDQAESLGETLTGMIGTTADRMNSIWFTAVVQGYEFKDTMTRIFRQLVADILAELAKLAAKKVFFDLLNLAASTFIPGWSAGAAAARVVNPGGGPGGNLGTIRAPQQGVLDDEVLEALRSASIEPREATISEAGTAALVRAIQRQPVQSEVVLPENPFRAQVSALDRISAAVGALMGTAGSRGGPGFIQPPESPTTAPPSDLGASSDITRNVTFNITVNTGFGSRGAGLETARALVPFLREVGG